MTMRPIIRLPDPRLRLVSAPVATVDDSIRALMGDMLETMYDAPGIGLAAIQIGIAQRLVVIDLAKKEEEARPLFLVNPEIVWSSEEVSTYEEGCLSIPEYYEEIERPAKVKARLLDRDGQPREIEAEGELAAGVRHNI